MKEARVNSPATHATTSLNKRRDALSRKDRNLHRVSWVFLVKCLLQ